MNAEEYTRAIRAELSEDSATARSTGTGRRPPVIEIRDVWLSFDRPILCGVDLEVPERETRVVLGESGSGKSTLLKLIMRMLVPDRGSVRVFGRDISRLSFEEALDLRRRIGMVFQNAALFDSMTVYENVAYPLRENTRMNEAEIEERVHQRLDFVDLDPRQVADKLPAELSGGMRKRVGLARAIATDPQIVLYDEPTAGLDPLAVSTINALMRKLQRELGVTSIVVTHDIRAGFRVGDRVSLLRRGEITFTGTPEEMVASDDPYIRAFLS